MLVDIDIIMRVFMRVTHIRSKDWYPQSVFMKKPHTKCL